MPQLSPPAGLCFIRTTDSLLLVPLSPDPGGEVRRRLDKTKVRTTELVSHEAAAGGAEGQGDPSAHKRTTPVSPLKSSWQTLCAPSDVHLHKSVCCARQPAAFPQGQGGGRWPTPALWHSK